MPELWFDNQKAKDVFFDEQKAKEVYFDDKLVHRGEYLLLVTASNHNCNADYLWNMLPLEIRNDQSIGVRIKIQPGVQLVQSSPHATTGCVIAIHGGWGNRPVYIENYGHILGRGANGGHEGQTGGTGGTAMYNGNTGVVSVENFGVIGGGGGGGGGSVLSASYGGGGGAPFGAGGWGSGSSGNAASFDTPGAGISWAGRVSGAGGGWGLNGAGGNGGGGGSAGAASRGTFNWVRFGDIRGARV